MDGRKSAKQELSERISSKRRVAILGGGIQGCVMALMFRKHGYDVSLYDKSTDIMNRASATGEGKVSCPKLNSHLHLSIWYFLIVLASRYNKIDSSWAGLFKRLNNEDRRTHDGECSSFLFLFGILDREEDRLGVA